MPTTDRIAQLRLSHLRRVEERVRREFTDEEIAELAPDLREISDEIKKIEVGDLWWVVGPGGKLYRCEKTHVAAESN